MTLDFSGLSLFNHAVEILKERIGIIRTRGRFRVILDGENRQFLVPQTFDRLIVEVDLGHDGAAVLEGLRVRGKTVILRRNGNFARLQILDGLIATAMAEFQFERRATERVREHLMPEADSKNWKIGNQATDGFVDVRQGGWITGPVGKKHGVDSGRSDFLVGGRGWKNMNLEAVEYELAEDRVLSAVVKSRDFEFFRGHRRSTAGCADRTCAGWKE